MTTLSGRVAVALIGALVFLIGVLLATHGIWFDDPSEAIQRRMDIICQLFVGVGTGALALVTWASVYETQQVLLGEDIRFRLSRMPMVSLASLPELTTARPWSLGVAIVNDGDGAAQNVSVSVEGKWILEWEVFQEIREVVVIPNPYDKPQPLRSETVEAPILPGFILATSYLGADNKAGILLRIDPLAAQAQPEERVANMRPSYQVTTLTIKYTDSFGEPYETIHDGTTGLLVQSFKRETPEKYKQKST